MQEVSDLYGSRPDLVGRQVAGLQGQSTGCVHSAGLPRPVSLTDPVLGRLQLRDGHHGGSHDQGGQVTAGVSRGALCQLMPFWLCESHVGTLTVQSQQLGSGTTVWEGDVDALVEPSEESTVQIPGTVGGTQQEDLFLARPLSAVHLDQQLSLDSPGPLILS